MENRRTVVVGLILFLAACNSDTGNARDRAEKDFIGAPAEVKIVTVAPGHFHAALVQKYSHDQLDDIVHVYAPDGPELEAHLALIEQFNTRADDPTHWQLQVYRGDDYFERMLADRAGNVMVVAGNNGRKIEYIRRAVEEGLNVLADKPMIIVPEDFPVLEETLELADARGLVVNDVMTERHAITSILQRELARIPDLFGELQAGTPEEPAITKESVHHFSKLVAGAPLVRPPWFFDVAQQGEGIVDVSTHLVDLILWQGFPEQPIDYADPADGVEVLSARVWDTPLTAAQFSHVTNGRSFPDYLRPNVAGDVLNVTANGEFLFKARGVHGKVSVLWGFENPAGGDTHFSVMRGTRANLMIRQDEPRGFVATLYVEPAGGTDRAAFEVSLLEALDSLRARYPGLSTRQGELGWEVVIPDEFREGHEDHFTRVTRQYLTSLIDGALPGWERTNLLTKYFITTKAYELSR
jgi:predicted dehydrogenase